MDRLQEDVGQGGNDRLEQGCAKCGACVPVCPVFREDCRESLTARGRMHLLQTAGDRSSAMLEDLLARCLLCGACQQVCPRHLPIVALIVRARSRFSPLHGPNGLQKAAARSILGRPALLDGLVHAGIALRRLAVLPADSGLRLKLGLLEERPAARPRTEPKAPRSNGTDYFAGCLARHLQPSIAQAVASLLSRRGQAVHAPEAQGCCGLAAWSSGQLELARELACRNIRAFSAGNGPILVSCSSCAAHFLRYPELFAAGEPMRVQAQSFASRVQGLARFFLSGPLPSASGPALRIFYQDPCHQRAAKDGWAAPRNLLHGMGFAVLEPEDGPLCCGLGGLFRLSCPETSDRIFARSCAQAMASKPDCIATDCSGCLMQYQMGTVRLGLNVRVAHPAVLMEERLRRSATTEECGKIHAKDEAGELIAPIPL